MSNPIQSKVDQFFKQDIPRLSMAIGQEINNQHIDPLWHLISGSITSGSVNLGLCHAVTNVSFSINDTKGLSQLEIHNLTVGTLHPVNAAQTVFYGTFNVDGTMYNIKSQIQGRIEAHCAFMHPSEGIHGSVESVAELNASGAFTVEVNGTHVTIKSISVQSVVLHFTQVSVQLSTLGVLFHGIQGTLINDIEADYRTRGQQTLQNMLSNPVHMGFQQLVS